MKTRRICPDCGGPLYPVYRDSDSPLSPISLPPRNVAKKPASCAGRGSDMGRRSPLMLRDAMAYAADMRRSSQPPECYYWSSVWWRLHARESANPREALTYSRNQFRLYRHMRVNPDSYRRRLGARSATDWQIFREITRVAEPAQQAQGQGGGDA